MITPDDKIFVGDYARGMLVRLDPVTGSLGVAELRPERDSGPTRWPGTIRVECGR